MSETHSHRHDATGTTFYADRGSVYLTFDWNGKKYKVPNIGWGLDDGGCSNRMVPLFHRGGQLYTAWEFPIERCPIEGEGGNRKRFVASANIVDEIKAGCGGFDPYHTEYQLREDARAYCQNKQQAQTDSV